MEVLFTRSRKRNNIQIKVGTLIILNYPKYVGGKFISNCIALSRHCVIQDRRLALLDIKSTSADTKYYEFKLNAVLKSLPDAITTTNWAKHEFGCTDLYGINEYYYNTNNIKDIVKKIDELEIFKTLRDNNKDSCIIAHDYRAAVKYLLVHKDAKFVEFKNFDRFRSLAQSLKSPVQLPDYEESAKHYYLDQEFFKLDSYQIDVDTTFFNWEEFDSMMVGLYNYLGFDDYQPELIKQFYTKYIALHV